MMATKVVIGESDDAGDPLTTHDEETTLSNTTCHEEDREEGSLRSIFPLVH